MLNDDNGGASVESVLANLLTRITSSEDHKLGFPGWSKALESELAPFLRHELNNYGDPVVDPVFGWHTKHLERDLVDAISDLFQAPTDDRWGYVTAGGSEGILHGLWQARTLYRNATVYHSVAAHGSVAKAVQILDRRAVAIQADYRGEMDYVSLREALLSRGGDEPVVIVATIGTTMTEAVDDVPRILAIVREAGIRHAYVHADAALAGIPLAVLGRLNFGLGPEGVDSLSISGHKFFGVPWPCGILLTRGSHRDRINRIDPDPDAPRYTGSPEPTVGSSRNGHSALVMWYRWAMLGADGMQRLAQTCTEVAAYTEQRLIDTGWDAWRAHPHAFTVVIKAPPDRLLARWPLATVDGRSHLVCTPGVTPAQVDRFVADLHTVTLGGRLD